MELKFRLKPTTDYHIGAGAGLGSQIDSALMRDSDGVPVQRSNIEGLLRDGLWRLLQTRASLFALHPQEEGREAESYCRGANVCPLCRILGTPASPKKWRISSARPVGIEKPLNKKSYGWEEGKTGSQVVSRNKVSPRTRRAQARHLFRQEEGDKRIEFEFTVSCYGDDKELREEAAMIIAAARMVRRFGSARRRGRGECFVTLASDGLSTKSSDALTKDWLNVFRSHWLEEQPIENAPEKTERTWLQPSSTLTSPIRCRVIVRLDEPLVIAKRAAAGNMFDGLDYINSTTLWGAFLNESVANWRLRKREDKRDIDFYEDDYKNNGAYKAFVDFLIRGLVRFSPLYPAEYAPYTLIPMIPMPLDVLTCKAYPDFKWQDRDFLHHGATGYATKDKIPEGCEQCEMSLEALGGYLPLSEGASPRKKDGAVHCEEMHPRINPVTQRVATGDLFGYEALDSGQFFVGEIWCENETAWQTLCALTEIPQDGKPFNLLLGKATRRGYGLVTIAVEKLPDNESSVNEWRGARMIEERVPNLNKPITMTLLTDAILPDCWGRYKQTLDEKLLNELLDVSVETLNVFCQSSFVDGFNNHHGLPRWRDIALKAGSSVGFIIKDETEPSVLQDKLKTIEANGVGLRRNEGFGQVVFNHPIYKDHWREIKTKKITLESETLRELRLNEQSSYHTVKEENKALRDWENMLQPEVKKNSDDTGFKDGLFNEKEKDRHKYKAFARWLRENASMEVEELKTQLKEFGKSKLFVDEKEVKRDKDNESFANEVQRTELESWLDYTQNKATSPELRQKMIECLADRLMAATKKEGK